jgi:CRISPR-associated endonuclease/helicase Cas3
MNRELLLEHSKLSADYCLRLIEVHGMEKLLDESLTQLTEKLPIDNKLAWGNLLKKAFYGAIVYHDLGKVNPNFQLQKMENKCFSLNKKLSIESNHSLLGAYIFANIFFDEICRNDILNNDEQETLYFIVLLFACTIIKHHNSAVDVVLDYEEMQIDDCYSFLENVFHILLDENFCKSFFMEAHTVFDDINNMISDKEIYFQLFAITKLLYSLLTASDFYATNEFMTKIRIDDFGVLNAEHKQYLISKFQTVKSYNHDLYANLGHYLSFSFDELEKRNNENMNILRQKLTAEMISNLRKNRDNHCFYIEAPTGAGKTNLSLAFATELLNTDTSLNKIFYVFPFTTLITQTYKSIQETLEINDDLIIQIHSKAGFHEKEDGAFGAEKKLFMDNLFVNYPIALISHIRFFDILKGNEKENNYLLHRLYNSIVIIDEIQTYNPEHWDKTVYFLAHYAKIFNIRILIMSATLPKIDALHENIKGTFVSLISNRDKYFTNNNFSGRVTFDFTLRKKPQPTTVKNKELYLMELADFMMDKTDKYASLNQAAVRVLIEFITKKTASMFLKIISKNEKFNDYEILLLSGDILEFRRKEIISWIKENKYPKVIVVSTQVVEAGVDIDMDLGFKDRSLIDSDEQLSGRINRNASKNNCIVYLFDCDYTSTIYGSDTRYKVQQTNKDIYDDYENILQKKQFHSLYEKVFEEKRKKMGSNLFAAGHYYQYFRELDFSKLHREFKLIENNDNQQLFIPISIPVKFFNNHKYLEDIDVLSIDRNTVDGEKVFKFYENIIHCKFDDFASKQIEYKKLGSVMSQFCISVYRNQLDAIADMLDPEKSKYGYKYLLHWELCYSPEYGFDSDKIDTSRFL